MSKSEPTRAAAIQAVKDVWARWGDYDKEFILNKIMERLESDVDDRAEIINFVTAIEHQVYRTHPYTENCPECRLAIHIANNLRDELFPPEGEQSQS
jgi:transposase-like protein